MKLNEHDPWPTAEQYALEELKQRGDLGDMMALYEVHCESAHARALLAEYAACVLQITSSARALAKQGEVRWSFGLESRARDLVNQAKRHVETIAKREPTP